MIGLIAIVIACVAVILNFLDIPKKKGMSGKTPGHDVDEKEISAQENIVKEMQNVISELEARISQMDKEIRCCKADNDTMFGEIREIKNGARHQSARAAKPTNQNLSTATVNKPEKPRQSVRMYVQKIEGEGFPNDSLRDDLGKFVKFELSISGSQATYSIPDDETVQEKLISSYNSIRPYVEEVSSVASPVRILTEEPGKLKLEDGIWKVERKAKVKLI